MKLAVFDMDGVLFRGENFWLDLHKALGTEKYALELWDELGDRDYVLLSEKTARHWKGLDRKKYDQLIARREYFHGAKALMRSLRRHGVTTAIVSSGPYHLAERAKDELALDIIFANKLGITEEGRFDGTVDVQVDNNRKGICVKSIQNRLKISPDETMIIGDTESDLSMAKHAHGSIGFRVEDETVRDQFQHSVGGKSLVAVKNILHSAMAS